MFRLPKASRAASVISWSNQRPRVIPVPVRIHLLSQSGAPLVPRCLRKAAILCRQIAPERHPRSRVALASPLGHLLVDVIDEVAARTRIALLHAQALLLEHFPRLQLMCKKESQTGVEQGVTRSQVKPLPSSASLCCPMPPFASLCQPDSCR